MCEWYDIDEIGFFFCEIMFFFKNCSEIEWDYVLFLIKFIKFV